MNEIQENDYKEILLQAVAVIENAHTNIVRHLATTISSTYWKIALRKEIGKQNRRPKRCVAYKPIGSRGAWHGVTLKILGINL